MEAFQHETEFLSGVEANFNGAKGKQFRGTIWQLSHHDEGDRLRATMAEHRCYDRELLKSLPSNRRVTLRGFERHWLLWKRGTGVATASVLSPLEDYVRGEEGAASPIGLGDLVDHVRRIVGDSRVPHVIGVCSPTGFSEEVRQGRLELPNVTLVLIEPDERGGWSVAGANENVDARVLRIFDPEGSKQKLERVEQVIEESSAELLTGSLSVSQVAQKSSLPNSVVQQAFERIAGRDPELRLTKQGEEVLLFRGASARSSEKKPMNVIDRIRQLFSGEGDDVDKVNVLAERRAALSQRRDRVAEGIAGLEKREAELLEAGKASKSEVVRRRMASQLAQLRKDIRRQHTTLNMLNQQVNIISTDIHNLTLIQQGEIAQLPSSDELTEHAVAAEEMLETLKGDAEMVQTLEADQTELVTTDEELDILKEFEQTDEPAKTPAEPAKPQRAQEPARAGEPDVPTASAQPDSPLGESTEPASEQQPTDSPPSKDAEPT